MAREIRASNCRSDSTAPAAISGLAPKPTAYRVLGRLAVTALAIASEMTEGGELRFAFASDRRDLPTASACALYGPLPEVFSRLAAAIPPHSVRSRLAR